VPFQPIQYPVIGHFIEVAVNGLVELIVSAWPGDLWDAIKAIRKRMARGNKPPTSPE